MCPVVPRRRGTPLPRGLSQVWILRHLTSFFFVTVDSEGVVFTRLSVAASKDRRRAAQKSAGERLCGRSPALCSYSVSEWAEEPVSEASGELAAEPGLTNPKLRVGLPLVDRKCQAISSISVLLAKRLSA